MDEIASVLEVLTAAVKFITAVWDFVKLSKKSRTRK